VNGLGVGGNAQVFVPAGPHILVSSSTPDNQNRAALEAGRSNSGRTTFAMRSRKRCRPICTDKALWSRLLTTWPRRWVQRGRLGNPPAARASLIVTSWLDAPLSRHIHARRRATPRRRCARDIGLDVRCCRRASGRIRLHMV